MLLQNRKYNKFLLMLPILDRGEYQCEKQVHFAGSLLPLKQLIKYCFTVSANVWFNTWPCSFMISVECNFFWQIPPLVMKKNWFLIDSRQIKNQDYMKSVFNPTKSARLASFAEFTSYPNPVKVPVTLMWNNLYSNKWYRLQGQKNTIVNYFSKCTVIIVKQIE